MISRGNHCITQRMPSHYMKQSRINMSRSDSRSRSRSRSPGSTLSRVPNFTSTPDSPHSVSSRGSARSMQSSASTSSNLTRKSKITMNRSVSRSLSRSRSHSTTPLRHSEPSTPHVPDSPLSVSSMGSTSSLQSQASSSSLRSYGSIASSGACHSKDNRDETPNQRRSLGDEWKRAKEIAASNRSGQTHERRSSSETESKESSRSRPRSRSRTARQPDISFEELIQLPEVSSSPPEASGNTHESRGSRPSSSRSTSFRGGRLQTRGRQLTREGSVPKLQTANDSNQDKTIAPLRVIKRSDSKTSVQTEEQTLSSTVEERVSSRRRGLQRCSSNTSMATSNAGVTGCMKEKSQQNPRNSLSRRLARYEDACIGRPDESTVLRDNSNAKSRSDHVKETAGVGNVAAKVRSFSRCRSDGSLDDNILTSSSRRSADGPRRSLVRNHARQRSCSPGSKSVTTDKPLCRRGIARSQSFSKRSESTTTSDVALLGGLVRLTKGKHFSSSSHGEYSSGSLGDYLRGKGPEKGETGSAGYVPKAFLVFTKDEDEDDEEPDFFDK